MVAAVRLSPGATKRAGDQLRPVAEVTPGFRRNRQPRAVSPQPALGSGSPDQGRQHVRRAFDGASCPIRARTGHDSRSARYTHEPGIPDRRLRRPGQLNGRTRLPHIRSILESTIRVLPRPGQGSSGLAVSQPYTMAVAGRGQLVVSGSPASLAAPFRTAVHVLIGGHVQSRPPASGTVA